MRSRNELISGTSACVRIQIRPNRSRHSDWVTNSQLTNHILKFITTDSNNYLKRKLKVWITVTEVPTNIFILKTFFSLILFSRLDDSVRFFTYIDRVLLYLITNISKWYIRLIISKTSPRNSIQWYQDLRITLLVYDYT